MPSHSPRNFFGPSRPRPVETRTPSRRRAFRIATSRPDDRLLCYRASARAPWSHRPVNRRREADPTHHGDCRLQQLAHAHHPTVQRRTADLHARFAFQYRLLPVQRKMIAIFRHHRVDHHRVAGQSLLHNARRQFRHRDAGTFSTSAFFAFRHPHEPARWFHVQHFAFVVADDRCCAPTVLAVRLRACNHAFDARQILR